MIVGIIGKGMKEYSYVIVFVLVLFIVFYTMSTVFAADIDAGRKAIIVEEGDTLWGIAMKYHQDIGISIQEYVDRLKRLNELETVLIYPGQELEVLVALK